MKAITFAIFVGILIGVFVMVLITQKPSQPQQTTQDRILTPTATILSAETIVKQITSVDKLITAEAIVETVVELENNEQFFIWRSSNQLIDVVITTIDKALGKRYIKMQGSGIIKAGVDLSKLDTSNDITFSNENKTITIELPPSELLGTIELNASMTHPLALKHGLLISKNDYTITEQGYTEVINQLNRRGCNSEVLQLAANNAAKSVERLVRAFNPNLTEVIVNKRSGNCGS